MVNSNQKEMGAGSVKKRMVQMAIPAVAAQVINLLYNIVDRIYIGHIPEIGAAALTGVGLFTPMLMLITAFSLLCSAGGGPRAAIAMGKGKLEEAERILANCFTLLMLMTVVLTVVLYAAAPWLLRLFGGSDNTLPYALAYGRIYILGSVFVMLVMGLNPFITTQGFAGISMLTTVIGAVINIVLDPIFIFVLNLGVRGAAIATVLSQAVSAVWILRFLTGKKTVLRLKRANMPLRAGTILPCLGLGASSFVMISTESLLSVCFTSSLARYGGDLAVGAMTVLTSINQLVSMPLNGLCQGGQPLISYNYGAGKMDRVREAFFCQFFACVCYSTVFGAAVRLFPGAFVSVFTDNGELVAYSAWALRIFLGGVAAMGFQMSCQQAFVALGQARFSVLFACLRKLVLLIPMIYLLPLFFADKPFAVFLAEPVSDVLAAAATCTSFFLFFRKLK